MLYFANYGRFVCIFVIAEHQPGEWANTQETSRSQTVAAVIILVTGK